MTRSQIVVAPLPTFTIAAGEEHANELIRRIWERIDYVQVTGNLRRASSAVAELGDQAFDSSGLFSREAERMRSYEIWSADILVLPTNEEMFLEAVRRTSPNNNPHARLVEVRDWRFIELPSLAGSLYTRIFLANADSWGAQLFLTTLRTTSKLPPVCVGQGGAGRAVVTPYACYTTERDAMRALRLDPTVAPHKRPSAEELGAS